MKILFVCTGNTCRSPMAETVTKAVFKNKGIDADVESRGMYAQEGEPSLPWLITAFHWMNILQKI